MQGTTGREEAALQEGVLKLDVEGQLEAGVLHNDGLVLRKAPRACSMYGVLVQLPCSC